MQKGTGHIVVDNWECIYLYIIIYMDRSTKLPVCLAFITFTSARSRMFFCQLLRLPMSDGVRGRMLRNNKEFGQQTNKPPCHTTGGFMIRSHHLSNSGGGLSVVACLQKVIKPYYNWVMYIRILTGAYIFKANKTRHLRSNVTTVQL